MNKDEKLLYALEMMNKELKNVYDSKEYVEGEKILRWKEIIKNHEILSHVSGFFKHRKASKIYDVKETDNISENDWKKYLHFGNENQKVVIYTCITGGYDSPKEPLLKLNNIDYIMFTDRIDKNKLSNSLWKIHEIPEKLLDYPNILINRYIKMHPHELFEDEYNLAIYIDGNVQTISDISVFGEMLNKEIGIAAHQHRFRDCIYLEEKTCELKGKGKIEEMRKQIFSYEKQGFPQHYGMIECTVMVTLLESKKAKEIYNQWWDEFLKQGSLRDQLSFPFILWKNNIKISEVGTLGKNLYKNTKIRVYSH